MVYNIKVTINIYHKMKIEQKSYFRLVRILYFKLFSDVIVCDMATLWSINIKTP